MSKLLKYFIISAGIAFVISGYFFVFHKRSGLPIDEGEIITAGEKREQVLENKEIPKEDVTQAEEKIPAKNIEKIAEEILIEVPFTSQAPFAKWDAYHQEACEEASLIMLKYYFDGKKLTPEIAEKEIQAMIAYQLEKYGDYRDSDAEGMVELFEGFYGEPEGGRKLEVLYDFSKNDLKKYLSLGHPIIVPAAGRLLGNPYFTAPGPPYHALVLIGYDDNTIITNDPGTRRGEGYEYDINILYNAIHDFPGNLDEIEKGRKAIIVVK